ncbi:MAG: lipid II flippase MurJ [Candidatus Acidiferrales bacterium]
MRKDFDRRPDQGEKVNLSRLVKWKYSPSLFFSGANTLCSVVFQFANLSKLGVGARSDLYFASIVMPMVLFTLAFGALNNVLIPMFVEAKANGQDEELAAFWNSVFVTFLGGLLLLAALYYPMLYAFPLMFRKLAWIDSHQVGRAVLIYSAYQVLFCVLAVKNCYLFAQKRATSAQISVFCGWLLSLFLLWRIHPIQNLGQIPLCLVAGNALALVFPNLARTTFTYRRGFFRAHLASLVSRNLPLILGGSVSRVEPLFDGVLASFCREGSLTIYYFFGRIMLYMSTITFSGYMQPEQTRLAEIGRNEQWDALRLRTRSVAIRSVIISFVLLAGGILFLGALYLLRFGPAMPYFRYFSNDLPVFFLMLGYLVGVLASIAYSNSLYVLREERLFLIASVGVLPLGVLLKFCGAYAYGLRGLGLSTSLYWILNAAALAYAFSWSLGRRKAASTSAGFGGVSPVEMEVESVK